MRAAARLPYTVQDSTILTKLPPSFSLLLRDPVCLLAFGFGSGLAPKAPGTFGTLPAFPVAWLLAACGIEGGTLALMCIPLFLAGIFICSHAERVLGVSDYGGIVWDEIVAMLLVLAFTPDGWAWQVAAFAAFRLFDAVKPWPIKWFDRRVHGGFGIMLDDLIAALFALAVLHAAALLC